MNRVLLNKYEHIEIIVDGDQTVDSIDAMVKDIDKLVKAQRKAKKPVLIVDNITDVGKVPTEPRKKVVEVAKNLDYDRLAFVGKSATLRFAANLILQAIGKRRQVKYFDDYDTALQWLDEHKK